MRPLVYLVATSHLDTQWRWTIQDTIREFIPRTLRENFAHFESDPDYVLSFEGAFRYMLMKEYYPDDYERLKGWIAKGRWRVAGSMLDAPDVNVPSPESLLRHILYGNGFFEAEFGRRSVDLFLPDCFGFSHALPSIAAHCGLVGFSSQKFGRWMAPAEIPFDLGFWEGPDGHGVVAAIRPGGYGEGLPEDPSRNPDWLREVATSGRESGVYVGYKLFGIGDRGGAVGPESLDNLRAGLAGEGPLRVIHSGSDQIYRDLDRETVAKLPRHRGELLLPRHGSGCLTSQAALKRWNRKNEQLADAAERAAVIASWLSGTSYSAAELRDAWLRFLWHQMHDDLTGTSIPEAYAFTYNDEAIAANRFRQILEDSIETISRGLDTRTDGEPLVVFNPLAMEREEVVEAEVRFPHAAPEHVRVLGPDGGALPAQLLDRDGDAARIACLASLPSFGLAVLEVRPTASPAGNPPELAIGEDFLENHRYRAEIDDQGDLARLYDKEAGAELLAAPVRLQLLVDRSTRWPAWEVLYDDLTKPPRSVVGGLARVRVVERGPVRVALEVHRRFGRSTLVQTYRLATGGAGECLEVDHRLDWRTRRRLLKAAFPLAVSSPTATYDLGLGVIERGNNTPQKYEVPAQQWADLSEGGRGVSILNDCKYGWDKPDDGTLRLTLVRSPRALRRFRHQGVQDFGEHRFRYALYGHADSWADGETVRQAARFNQPPVARPVRRHPGALGRSFSFLADPGHGIAVSALKRAERGDDLVLRLRESRGREAERAQIRFASRVAAARQVDGCERPLGALEPTVEGGLEVSPGPFEPRTLAIRLTPPAEPLPPLPHAAVPLPLDLRATARQGEARSRGFDGRGNSFPAELFPTRVRVGEIELPLGSAAAANCLPCTGQSLELPEGDWSRLVAIAAAIDGDSPATFVLGEREQTVEIHDWAEPIARPEVRRDLQGLPWAPPRPASRKNASIAWYATHRHDRNGADQPYVFGYLFRYSLEIPSGAREVRLPENAKVRLFALAVDRTEEAPGAGVAGV